MFSKLYTLEIPKGLPDEVKELFESARDQIENHILSERYQEMTLIRDQLRGGKKALSDRYHPPIEGLKEENRKKVEKARTHVNLAQPALDRLVNSIHSGLIHRELDIQSDIISKTVTHPRYTESLTDLCSNAFAYGTGYLCPIYDQGRFKYWLPDPLFTILVTDPFDIDEVVGIIECVYDQSFQTTFRGFRFLSRTYEGWIDNKKKTSVINEHGQGNLPCVVAYGNKQRCFGDPYGRSLILPAAEASILVTNNDLNANLLRDLQTNSILLIYGDIESTSEDDNETLQRYAQFKNRDGGMEYITPESRLQDVIELGKVFRTNASVSTGLPIDTFLPEVITGSDASATAARQRAFPLQQKMHRLINQWEEVELSTLGLVTSMVLNDQRPLDDLIDDYNIRVDIKPSNPEADSETLANYIQKANNYYIPVEDVINYYSKNLSQEKKDKLMEMWNNRYGEKEIEIISENRETDIV